jgi:hypothetical protein
MEHQGQVDHQVLIKLPDQADQAVLTDLLEVLDQAVNGVIGSIIYQQLK